MLMYEDVKVNYITARNLSRMSVIAYRDTIRPSKQLNIIYIQFVSKEIMCFPVSKHNL